jgi:hypothetical protein
MIADTLYPTRPYPPSTTIQLSYSTSTIEQGDTRWVRFIPSTPSMMTLYLSRVISQLRCRKNGLLYRLSSQRLYLHVTVFLQAEDSGLSCRTDKLKNNLLKLYHTSSGICTVVFEYSPVIMSSVRAK